MKNPKIGSALKEYRKKAKLSVEEVSAIFEHANRPAATKTIYAWEAGRTQPDADTLMYLCWLYRITNSLEAFGYQEGLEPNVGSLTEEEKSIILNYRNQPELQPAIRKLLDIEASTDHANINKINYLKLVSEE